MEKIGNYALEIKTDLSFDETIEKVTDLLKKQGFGILTEIDVQSTLKNKLGVDWKAYKILGACNPAFAFQALQEEQHIGVFLPCNIVIWDEGDHRVVTAMEPNIMGNVIDNPELSHIANQISNLIKIVLKDI